MSKKYCVNCGTKLDEETKMCPNCGKSYNLQVTNKIYEKHLDELQNLIEFLEENEQILLQSSTNSRRIQKVLDNILVGSIFGAGILVGYIIGFFLIYPTAHIAEFIIFITSFIIIFSVPLYPLIKGLRQYKLIKITTQLPFKQLRKYTDISILTNKRWIQKSLDLLKIDFSKYPSDVLEIQGDIILIDIKNIHLKDTNEGLYNTEITGRMVYLNSFETVPYPLHLGNILGTSEHFEQFFKDAKQKVGIRGKIQNDGSKVIYFFKL